MKEINKFVLGLKKNCEKTGQYPITERWDLGLTPRMSLDERLSLNMKIKFIESLGDSVHFKNAVEIYTENKLVALNRI